MEKWIMHLVGAAVLSMIAVTLTPDGRVKKAVKLICGFAVMLSLISGFIDFDYSFYSKSLADHKRDAEEFIANSMEEQSLLEREYIENECAAYILDKAMELGVDCYDATVKVRWSEDGYWYPVSAEIGANANSQLADAIEGELGIPIASQTWRNGNEQIQKDT